MTEVLLGLLSFLINRPLPLTVMGSWNTHTYSNADHFKYPFFVQHTVLARIKAFCSSPYDRMNCIGPERLCERIVQTLRKDDGCESTLAIYMKYMLMIFVQY